MEIRIVSNESGDPTTVIVSIELWRRSSQNGKLHIC